MHTNIPESRSASSMARAVAASPIENPDAAYLAATTKIDIDQFADGTTLDSISDGTLTVSFSDTVAKLPVPDTWATWSSPPFSEDPGKLSYNLTLALRISMNRSWPHFQRR